jgi:hypothetical protein
MIGERSLSCASSRSSCRSDVPPFRGEAIVESKKDMKVYTLETSESGTRVRTQSPPVCNVKMFKVER